MAQCLAIQQQVLRINQQPIVVDQVVEVFGAVEDSLGFIPSGTSSGMGRKGVTISRGPISMTAPRSHLFTNNPAL
jgi:hypothetical protein